MTTYAYECATERLVDEVKKMTNMPAGVKRALLVVYVAALVDQAMNSDNHEDIEVDDLEAAIDGASVSLSPDDYAWELEVTRWLYDNVLTKKYPIEEYPEMTYENCLNRYWAKQVGVLVA